MQFVLFEDEKVWNFYPFVLTRPVYFLRIGILRIYEKWERYLGTRVGFLMREPLKPLYQSEILSYPLSDVVLLNGRWVPDQKAAQLVKAMEINTCLTDPSGALLACRVNSLESPYLNESELLKNLRVTNVEDAGILLEKVYHLFQYNGKCIEADYHLLTNGRESERIEDPYTRVYEPERIFVEPGARIRASILNPAGGYIYIGKDAVVEEGTIIHGSHGICDNAVVLMGARLRGDSTIGPHCKVGGEVANTIFDSYSNKAHDGYLGNAVIGAWCNLGANTVSSNLKNTYAPIQLYDITKDKKVATDIQFCGALMGDHCRTGIQTMLNTATMLGVCVNLFGAEFPPSYLPSFVWGGVNYRWQTFHFEKALESIERMMQRRNQSLTEAHVQLLRWIYEFEMERRERFLSSNRKS